MYNILLLIKQFVDIVFVFLKSRFFGILHHGSHTHTFTYKQIEKAIKKRSIFFFLKMCISVYVPTYFVLIKHP